MRIWVQFEKKSLFLTTNINKENMYWDWNGRIDNFLNKFQQETLLPELVIIHIILFWILNIVLEWVEPPQKIMPYDITEWAIA
jgi:PhoPQ-activated pathogenicity-related protein